MDYLIKTILQDDSVYLFMEKKRAQGKLCYAHMTAGANNFFGFTMEVVKEYPTSL